MDCFTSPYGHRGKAVEGGGHAYPEPESSAKPGPSVPSEYYDQSTGHRT